NPGGGSNLGELGIGMMGLGAMQQQQQLQQMQQQMMQQQMGQQGGQQAAPQQAASTPSGGMPDVMTPAQAAVFVQVGESDIIAAIEAGDLKARKIGTAYRISKANLEEFLGG
ncbi:MAG: helix-turn-helix domain-containing protein, partial [Candidatus Promineifilaceae bacterium]